MPNLKGDMDSAGPQGRGSVAAVKTEKMAMER